MKGRRRVHTRGDVRGNLDVDGALEAMTAPELRSFLRGVLDGLHAAARAEIVDSLMARAAKARSGLVALTPTT